MPIKPDKTKSTVNTPPSINDVDPLFEPWEPVKPIPLFLLAIMVVLACIGVAMYLTDTTSSVEITETPAVNHTLFASPDPAGTPSQPVPLLVSQGRDDVWSCISCHGALGQGASITPRIAGLPKEYVSKQLNDFASGARHHDTMSYVARALSAEDITELADYYASLAIPILNLPPTDADLQRGQDIFLHGSPTHEVVACMTCHGADGRGMGGVFPPLAGQQPDYLFSQLLAWKGGRRQSTPPPLMEPVTHLDAEDLYAVAHYVATLPPTVQEPDVKEGAASGSEASP